MCAGTLRCVDGAMVAPGGAPARQRKAWKANFNDDLDLDKALPALLRGKEVLVVGDSKQVSPTAAFCSEARVASLKVGLLNSRHPFVRRLRSSFLRESNVGFLASSRRLREESG